MIYLDVYGEWDHLQRKKNGENGIIMVLLENLFDDENICSCTL